MIERADVFTLREATRQSGVSLSAALDGSGSTLFAPGRSALDFACAQKWHINSFALPLNVRILHFWRIALGGGISMTPARRNCRARSRARIGYSTPFIESSLAVGIEPFERGAESRLGDRGLGCCGGDSAVLERSRARRPPLGSAGGSRSGDSVSATAHGKMDGLPCFALETDFFQNPLTKVSHETL